MQKWWLALLLWAIQLQLLAQVKEPCKLVLEGTIQQQGSSEPVAFVHIAVAGTSMGTYTDEHGHYAFRNLCPGSYVLQCTHVGFDHLLDTIVLNGNATYNFHLHEHTEALETVVFEVKGGIQPVLTPVKTLEAKEFSNRQSLPLAEAMALLPGVNVLKTGQSIAKPVIQGMHSSRVLVFQDGVRLEGNQWGVEHAPEVDMQQVDHITIARGADALKYGSDGIGGIVILEKAPILEVNGYEAQIGSQLQSNGRGGLLYGSFQQRLSQIPLGWKVSASAKRSGNLQTPDYYLLNTGVKELNGALDLNGRWKSWEWFFTQSVFSTQLGILRDGHIGNLTDLANALNRGRPSADGFFSYYLARPYQNIQHHVSRIKALWKDGPGGNWSFLLSRQYNRRQEYDLHTLGKSEARLKLPDFELELTSWAGDFQWSHGYWNGFRGTAGIQVNYQDNLTDFGGLIPDYQQQGWAAYWTEQWKKAGQKIRASWGLRYEFRKLDARRAGTKAIEYHEKFDGLSAIGGLEYQLLPHAQLSIEGGLNWRNPNPSELFSNGIHHGAVSFEKGDLGLSAERARYVSATLTWGHSDHGWSGYLQAYHKNISDFIFLKPSGEPVLSIRGAFPAFEYHQNNAVFNGIDGKIQHYIYRNWLIGLQGSTVRAYNRDRQEWLPLMPADRLGTWLSWKSGKSIPLEIKMNANRIFQQNRISGDLDYAATPQAAWVFDLESNIQWKWRGQAMEGGFLVRNLFNNKYRDYLNRFRYFVDEPGINLLIQFKTSIHSPKTK